MTPDAELGHAISASLTRICAHSAFFATLALFARVEQSQQVPTAATDGQRSMSTPTFMPLSPAERDGLLLHEALHAALRRTAAPGVGATQSSGMLPPIL